MSADRQDALEVALGPDDLYAAIVVYACDVAVPDHQPLYQECYTLIRADGIADAIRKAQTHGRRRLSRYRNGSGQEVTWTLKAIVDVRPLTVDRFEDQVFDLSVRHFRDYGAYDAVFDVPEN